MKQFVLTLALMLSCMASAKDIRVLVVKTQPEMKCERCAQKIRTTMKFTKGLKSIDPDHTTKLTTIRYDAEKGSVDAIREEFKKGGYVMEVVSEKKEETNKK